MYILITTKSDMDLGKSLAAALLTSRSETGKTQVVTLLWSWFGVPFKFD